MLIPWVVLSLLLSLLLRLDDPMRLKAKPFKILNFSRVSVSTFFSTCHHCQCDTLHAERHQVQSLSHSSSQNRHVHLHLWYCWSLISPNWLQLLLALSSFLGPIPFFSHLYLPSSLVLVPLASRSKPASSMQPPPSFVGPRRPLRCKKPSTVRMRT
jgi:hypothetical protein